MSRYAEGNYREPAEISCGPCDGQGHLPGPCPESKTELTLGQKHLLDTVLNHLYADNYVELPRNLKAAFLEGCDEPDCDHLICPKCEGTGVQEFIGGQHYE